MNFECSMDSCPSASRRPGIHHELVCVSYPFMWYCFVHLSFQVSVRTLGLPFFDLIECSKGVFELQSWRHPTASKLFELATCSHVPARNSRYARIEDYKCPKVWNENHVIGSFIIWKCRVLLPPQLVDFFGKGLVQEGVGVTSGLGFGLTALGMRLFPLETVSTREV